MASWRQKNRSGTLLRAVSGRALGLFGVVKCPGGRYAQGYQVDHLPSGFKVAEVKGWDYGLHVKLAAALNRLVKARYKDDASNPWLFADRPPAAVLEQMKVDLGEAKLQVEIEIAEKL